MKQESEQYSDHESMPEIKTIGYTGKPSEESIIHKYSHISRIYQRIYGNRPESWDKWKPVWTHRIRV